ncbi:MAG TPA: sulfotransferase domain-containing protein [Gammaproteobacteria bacterium]|nr:sulfotransferase domain-containing protein [Gammaproteobacteria bacterium]
MTNSFASSVSERFRWYQWAGLRRINDFDPEGNLLIISSPRGGSSWITDLISTLPKTVVLWEPLHLDASSAFRELNFCWQQYIPEDANWDEAKQAIERVLRGKMVNTWTCMRGSRHRFLTADKMVVKLCHAVALLPWLTREFNFRFAPIYLVRHPFAVVASQMQWHAWDYEFTGFDIPACPYNEIYRDHAAFLTSLKTKAEALVASWCIANLVPLSSARNDASWITVYYERLLMDPWHEISRIFGRWGLPIPTHISDRIRKPSQTTNEATFVKGVERQLAKWKSYFSEDDVKRMMAVLDYFSLNHYGRDVYPLTELATAPGATIRTGRQPERIFSGLSTIGK